MKFPDTPGSFATSFSICNTSIDIRYEDICKDLCECLTIIDLEFTKVSIKNYLGVTSSKFIALCCSCVCEIKSKLHANLCGSEIDFNKYAQNHNVVISLLI